MKSYLTRHSWPIACVLMSLLLLFLSAFSASLEPNSGNEWLLGRFHPMLVHFPIVLILLCLVLWGIDRLKKWPIDARWYAVLIGLSVLTTFVSALLGLFLYWSGEYQGELLNQHLQAGVALSIGVNICAICWYYQWNKMLLGGFILLNGWVIYTGHLGGQLTHGKDYLPRLFSDSSLEQAPIIQKPEAELLLFEDIIMSVFEAKCRSCHNEQKAKGKLAMHSYEALQAGGSSQKSMIVSQQPKQGLLYQRIHLPLSHEDHMPPKGKAQLTEAEQKLIDAWLDLGGSADLKLGDIASNDSLYPVFSGYVQKIARRQIQQIQSIAERDKLAKKLMPLAESLGFEIGPDRGEDSLRFALSMKLPAAHITDASLVELLPYADGFSRISLVSAEVTDDGLYTLGQFPNLRHLFLAKTCLDGSGLSYLTGLEKLETLNLSETAIDDIHVLQLTQMPQLKQVFLYQTEVSANLIDALQKYLTETEVLYAPGDLY